MPVNKDTFCDLNSAVKQLFNTDLQGYSLLFESLISLVNTLLILNLCLYNHIHNLIHKVNMYTIHFSQHSQHHFSDELRDLCFDCYKCTTSFKCRDCYKCDNCDNCIDCYKCNNCSECYNCNNCFNCFNCKNCIGLSNEINVEGKINPDLVPTDDEI